MAESFGKLRGRIDWRISQCHRRRPSAEEFAGLETDVARLKATLDARNGTLLEPVKPTYPAEPTPADAATHDSWLEACAALDAEHVAAVKIWKGSNSRKLGPLRLRILRRVEQDLNSIRDGSYLVPEPRTLPWRFLPPPEPGEVGLSKIVG